MAITDAFSPRMWRCFSFLQPMDKIDKVFSTYVEVFLLLGHQESLLIKLRKVKKPYWKYQIVLHGSFVENIMKTS